jgi:uncharacterized protein
MKQRDFDPRRLDVQAFAKAEGQLAGSWPVATFERLADILAAGDGGAPTDAVAWSAAGHEVAVRGGAAEVWLHLQADTALSMVCQRCLAAYPHALSVRARFQFAVDEGQAAEMDAECEHDVLVISKELDLHELVEDELLLELPLVPRHEVCPQPLTPAAVAEAEPPRQHPFAALAGLRTRKL